MGTVTKFLMATILMAEVCSAMAGEYPWIAHPRTIDYPWQSASQWMARHEAYTARAAKGDIELLLLGDSITENWSTAEDIWQQHFACMSSTNFGISGDTTQNLLWRITHGELDHISPKAATLLIGTNNLGLRHDAPEDVARGILTILDTLHEKLPMSRIVVFGILPRESDGNSATLPQTIQAINADIAEHAKALGIRYVDLSALLADKQGRPLTGITLDGLHLSRKGYEIWAHALQDAIADLIPRQC